MKNNLRAVIYFRSNNREQFETENDIQVKLCKEYAERKNMQIVGIYKDEFTSDRTTKGRDGLNKLIDDSAKDLFDVVLIHTIERSSRSTQDYLGLMSELYENGVALVTAITMFEETEQAEILETLLAISKNKGEIQ